MAITICKNFHFDAAHYLPFYKGKCHNQHGHRWNLEIELSGSIKTKGPCAGMIMDFSILSRKIEQKVLVKYDHQDLNNSVCTNPTAENLLSELIPIIHLALAKEKEIFLERVRLYENPDAWAEWRV